MMLGYYTLLALSLAFLVIGIHQIMTVGWVQSYFVLMLSGGLLLWAQYKRPQSSKEGTSSKVKDLSRQQKTQKKK